MGNPTSTHTVVHSRSLSTDRQKTQALGPAKVNTGAAKNQKPKQEDTARRGRSPPDLTRQAPARKGQAPRPADASPVLAQLGLVVTTKDSHSFIHRCIHECSSDSLPFVPTTRLNKKHRVPLGRPGELFSLTRPSTWRGYAGSVIFARDATNLSMDIADPLKTLSLDMEKVSH